MCVRVQKLWSLLGSTLSVHWGPFPVQPAVSFRQLFPLPGITPCRAGGSDIPISWWEGYFFSILAPKEPGSLLLFAKLELIFSSNGLYPPIHDSFKMWFFFFKALALSMFTRNVQAGNGINLGCSLNSLYVENYTLKCEDQTWPHLDETKTARQNLQTFCLDRCFH